MKFGNYNKVNQKGVIPENTKLEKGDVIMGKVVPIRENKNDNTTLSYCFYPKYEEKLCFVAPQRKSSSDK